MDNATAITVVMAITQGIKATFNWIPNKYSALISLVVGIGYQFIYLPSGDWRSDLYNGAFIGLSASGLFSGTKSVVNYNIEKSLIKDTSNEIGEGIGE